MEIKHLGRRVRGGLNDHARFFLHAIPPIGDATTLDEVLAVLAPIRAEADGVAFVLYPGAQQSSGYWRLNTRREFALLPLLVRRIKAIGWRVATSQWDVGLENYSRTDEEFWRAAALAQAFFAEEK